MEASNEPDASDALPTPPHNFQVPLGSDQSQHQHTLPIGGPVMSNAALGSSTPLGGATLAS